MPNKSILTAIDRLKQIAVNLIESQETIIALASTDAPKFEISEDIQTAKQIMQAFTCEFQKQELQIMRLMSEWRKEVFPAENLNNKWKPLGNYGHTGQIERHEDDNLNYKRA
jgi:hypothetical protein